MTATGLTYPLPLAAFHIPSFLAQPSAPAVSSSPFPVLSSLRPAKPTQPTSSTSQQSSAVCMRDVAVEGFASERLFMAHRMVSGGWWEVQAADNNGRSCLCRLMARREGSERDRSDDAEVQLSPALLFHLTEGTTQGRVLQPTVSILLRPYNPPLSFASAPRPSSTPPAQLTSSSSPVSATSAVTLTRVCAPLSSGHARYDAAITRYFQQRRIVAQHQLVAIPLTSHHTCINATWTENAAQRAQEEADAEVEVEEEQEEQREEEEQDRVVRDVRARLRSSSPPVVFFRVTSTSASPYLCIEPGVTTISTEGSINASAPHSLARFLTHSNYHPSTVLLSPLLTRQCSDLYELIAPAASGTGGKGGFALLVKASAHAMVEETVQLVAGALGVHYLPLSLFTLLASPAFLPLSSPAAAVSPASTVVAYSSALSFITSCRPCLVHVRHLSALAAVKDNEKHIHAFLEALISSSALSVDDSVILVGECDDDDRVSAGVRGLFTHTYTVAAPDRDEREQVAVAALSDEQDIGAVDAEDKAEMARVLAGKSAGVSVGQLIGVVREGVRLGRRRWMEEEQQRRQSLQRNARHSASSASTTPTLAFPAIPLILEPFTVTLPDLLASLSAYTARTSVLAGTLATLPTTRWSDIGGLTAAKRQIQQLIDLPRLSALTQPTASTNRPPKPVKTSGGILLFGPPGTGKTLMAKAVAAESGMNFMSVKGPELLNMYVGESERNVRNVFTRARACAPCVIFFDELDSLAPRRGGGSDGGGVMDRVVSQLLTEMDGVVQQQGAGEGGKAGGILIIGATNRPDLLDAALMRPGRLDKLVYLGVSDGGDDGRLSILRALTRKMRLEDGGDWLAEVASRMEGRGYTGADCYGLVTDAMMIAVKRRIAEVREKVDELNRMRKEMYDDDGASSDNHENAGADADKAVEDELAVDEDELTPLAYLRSLPADKLVVQLTRTDFLQALETLVPSLSRDELQHYEQIRQKFVSEKGATTGRTEQHGSTRPLVGTQIVEKAKAEVQERKEDRAEQAVADSGKGEQVEEHKDVRATLLNGAGGHKLAAGGRGRRNKHAR